MSDGKLHAATDSPCSACPWLTSNHGKPHPHGWYLLTNLRRLWRGLRRAETMSCHPTDPNNTVPDGAPEPPPDVATRECAGALILKQREYMRFTAACKAADAERKKDALARYRKAHPKGLMREGLLDLAERAIFGGSPLGGLKLARPDMNLPVSHPDLVPWDAAAEGSS